MKNLSTSFIFLLVVAGLAMPQFLNAQTPEKLSYQAVIRNSADKLVANQTVGMKISIIYSTPTGTVVYAETQTPTTNANGLISIAIGTGTVVYGTFSIIEWTAGPHFIKTEIDPSGGTAYSITTTSELLSVPYAISAMYAYNATNVQNIPNNSVNSAKIQDETIATADLANSAVTEARIAAGAITAPKLASMGATAGQVLTYSGTAWAPVAMAPYPWLVNGSDIYFNTGKVGIGTTIPASSLHIKTSASEMARFESSVLSTSKWIGLYQDNTRKGMIWSINDEIKLRSDGGGLAFQTGGVNTDRVVITADGKTGIGDTTPDATLDVEGTVVIGAAGKVFSEIREITGTSAATGNYTSLSFPTGYTMSNTRILSAEINYNGSNWNTLGMFNIASDNTVGCSMSSTGIHMSYPDLAAYHSRAIRILLIKVQ